MKFTILRSSYIKLSCFPKIFQENTQRTSIDAKIIDCIPQSVRPSSWRQYLHNSSNMEKLTWCLHGISSICACILYIWGTLHSTMGKTWTPKPATNPSIYNDVLLARSAWAMVAQWVWEKPTNVWFGLRPTHQDGTQIQHRLGDKGPETRELRT
jgi:hypothetical protein